MSLNAASTYKDRDPVMSDGQDKLIHIYNHPAARAKDQIRLRDFEEAIL